jgi:hypothetical protein
MMFGFWDGDYDDAAEAVSLPVFMLAQAVESMEPPLLLMISLGFAKVILSAGCG